MNFNQLRRLWPSIKFWLCLAVERPPAARPIIGLYHWRNLKPITQRPAGPLAAPDGWLIIQTVRYKPKIDTIRSRRKEVKTGNQRK